MLCCRCQLHLLQRLPLLQLRWQLLLAPARLQQGHHHRQLPLSAASGLEQAATAPQKRRAAVPLTAALCFQVQAPPAPALDRAVLAALLQAAAFTLCAWRGMPTGAAATMQRQPGQPALQALLQVLLELVPVPPSGLVGRAKPTRLMPLCLQPPQQARAAVVLRRHHQQSAQPRMSELPQHCVLRPPLQPSAAAAAASMLGPSVQAPAPALAPAELPDPCSAQRLRSRQLLQQQTQQLLRRHPLRRQGRQRAWREHRSEAARWSSTSVRCSCIPAGALEALPRRLWQQLLVPVLVLVLRWRRLRQSPRRKASLAQCRQP